MDCPEIRTARMTLRPVRDSDRAEFVRVCAASWPVWRPWMPAMEPGETFDALFDKMLDRTARETRDGTGLPLAAFLPDGRMAAFVSVFNVVRGVFQSGSMGWRTNAELLRQGYGLEAITALLDHAFAPVAAAGLGLHRLQANVIPDNLPSLRLAERAGFRREGYGVRYLNIAGRWQDHVMLAKLADEHAATSAQA
jgi:ribosomal-protein-alanine N-acetyltransferase